MESDQQTADVVLRSSDGELFYAWKIFLSFASPVFRDMFSLPQSPDASNAADVPHHDGRPVVDLTENSSTVRHILSLCQPPTCSGKQFKPLGSIQELQDVLEATMKYDMEKVRSMAVQELTNPSFLREDPIIIYVLACQYACHEVARLAARHTLALPTLVHSYVPELEKINAGQLCRLLLYREACISAVCTLTRDYTWLVCTNSSLLFGCDDGENDVARITVRYKPSRMTSSRVDHVSVHGWWLEYMKKSGYVLQRCPHGAAVKDQELLNSVRAAISSSKCKQCEALTVWDAFRSFVDIFAKEVDRRVAEVEINLGF